MLKLLSFQLWLYMTAAVSSSMQAQGHASCKAFLCLGMVRSMEGQYILADFQLAYCVAAEPKHQGKGGNFIKIFKQQWYVQAV